MDLLLLIVLPFCAASSFLCAGMEAGVFALGRWRIAQQVRAGQERARVLYGFLQNAEKFLWTILVGNTLAAFAALWIVAMALSGALQGWLFAAAYAGAVLLFYAFFDLLPKMLFRQFPNRLCLALVTPFRLLHLALLPLVTVIEGLANLLLRWTGGKVFTGHVFSNREEFRQLLEDPSQDLTTEERGMVQRVLGLQNLRAGQVAIPFGRYPGIGAQATLREALARFREPGPAFLPVWTDDGSRQRLAGFLHLESVLYLENLPQEDQILRHATPATYIGEEIGVQEALRRLQRTGHRVAVVLGRNRREIGLITIEDVLGIILREATS